MTDYKIKVRNCPSPTGFLHIGTLRTALYNFLFAKKNSGKIVFRSEDTDRERSEQKFEDDIISGLENMGIGFDEGPFKQSERGEIYKKYLEKLLDKGDAYFCFMSPEELEEIKNKQKKNKISTHYPNTFRDFSKEKALEKVKNGEKYVIRLKLPEKEIIFNDLIKGEIKIHTKDLGGDFVIAKNLNKVLYNFAVVVDDFEMGISHILRGEDGISNTPKQILLYEKFGVKIPQFGHFPLILNSDKSKLSKRKNKVSVNDFLKDGYLKESLINFLALLGWSPKTEEEFFSLEDLIKRFSFEGVSKSSAVFDLNKLDFINSHYIKKLSDEKFLEKIGDFLNEDLKKLLEKDFEKTKKVILSSKERIKKLSEINGELEFFYNFEKKVLDENLFEKKKLKLDKEKSLEIIKSFYEIFEKLPEKDFEIQKIKEKCFEFIKKDGGKVGFYMWPLRIALSKAEFSPGAPEIMELLGKRESLERLKKIIN